MTSQQTGGLTPTRRTLVKGAAWSVPVVAMGSAAPAHAASQEVSFTNLGLACKLPGNSCFKQVGVNKGYTIAMLFCTTVRDTVTIHFEEATGLLCGETRTFVVGPDPLVLEGSDDGTRVCETVYLGLDTEPNSANCAISGSAAFTWTSGDLSGSGTLVFSAAATPPCSEGPPPGCQPPTPGSTTTGTESTTDEDSSTADPTG